MDNGTKFACVLLLPDEFGEVIHRIFCFQRYASKMGRMVICMRCGGGEVVAEVFFGGEKRGVICVDFGD